MLKVGSTYRCQNGHTRFKILAQKTVPCPRGFNYIGEKVGNGLIAYFNNRGEHTFQEGYNLLVDTWKWVIVLDDGKLSSPTFEAREELNDCFHASAMGYLGIDNGDYRSPKFLTPGEFKALYA